MKYLLLIICFGLACKGSSALDWNLAVKRSGSTINACSYDTVIFPYLFNLSESESIVSMTWAYHGNDVTKNIGTLFRNKFMTTRNYYKKVTLDRNGNFSMHNINMQDTGKYILNIQTQNKDQNKQTYTKELSLVVTENAMYKGNRLVAKLSNKADWNSDTESFSLSLTCGDFTFKDDNTPIDVKWITPDGSVKNSTKYSDGKFYLQLDNPVEGGQYVCKIPEQSSSPVCATSNDGTISIDEEKTRIILLENDSNKLKKQNKKLEEENKKLKEHDKKLGAQDEKLEGQVEKLEGQVEKLEGQVEKLQKQNDELEERLTSSCDDMKSFGSGQKNIHVTLSFPLKIYCDQDTDGGRWNVFQRRQDGSVDFYRGWSDYRNGFGDPDKEFWLGLEALHQMTNNGRKYELRFDLEKQDGSKYFAVYDAFSIGSESEGYAVHFDRYRGNAGDSFSQQRDMKFSTKDRDQDKHTTSNCAVRYHGAWWYESCHHSNLNGHYNDSTHAKGLNWLQLTGYHESLKKTEMKFRVQQQ